MNLDDLKRAYPPLSEEGRAAMMRTVHRIEEEAPVKKDYRWAWPWPSP